MGTATPKRILSKSKLSMYLRTQCDRELYLSLFDMRPHDMAAIGLPGPLKSRPNVQLITGAGRDFENDQYNMLVSRLTGHIYHSPSFGDLDLEVALMSPSLPALCIQPAIEPTEFRDAVLGNLGVAPAHFSLIPRLAGMRPDIVLIDSAIEGDWEAKPNGQRVRIGAGETRMSLSVVDLKNVAEGNSSYAAEVCLYALFLANWLVYKKLTHRFYVSEQTFLWTTPHLTDFDDLFKKAPTTPKPELIRTLMKDLSRESVDFMQFVPSVKKFFVEDLVRVIEQGDKLGWQRVDYHVTSKCNACDWLGNRDWLSPADLVLFDAAPVNYCVPAAKHTGHLSLVANLSRGARQILEEDGVFTVNDLKSIPSSAAGLSKHSYLKKQRHALGSKANSLVSNANAPAPASKLASIANNVELRASIVITFDSSSNRLTGIGLRSDYLPAYGSTDTFSHVNNDAFMVERNSDASEWQVLSSFIDSFVKAVDQIGKQISAGGNPKLPYTQIYFWEVRQYEELCNAFGRHLPQVLALKDTKKRAMAWLFPADDLMERSDGAISPALVFVQDLIERAMHLPVPHVYTLLGVAQVYSHTGLPPLPLDSFYSEPLSNGIPRERTAEIWANTSGVVEWGTFNIQLSEAVGRYRRHLQGLAYSLTSVVARLSKDFQPVIAGKAKRLVMSGVSGAQGVAFDSKLWSQWVELEHSTASTEGGRTLSATMEDLEARYEAIVLDKPLKQLGPHHYEFAVSADSLESKLEAPNGFLTLGFASQPGFPLENGYSLQLGSIDPLLDTKQLIPAMHKVIKAELLAFDRAIGTAEVKFSATYGGVDPTFQAAFHKSIIDFSSDRFYLVSSLPPNMTKDALDVLDAMGDPAIAKPDANSIRALGKIGKKLPKGTGATTTAAEVLWDAATLSKTAYRTASETARLLNYARAVALRAPNTSQLDAISGAAQSRLSLIWGPPGTGKTDTLATLLHAVVRESILMNTGKKLLITGPNYRAVEVLADRLLQSLSADSQSACDFYRAYSKSRPVPLSPALPPHITGTNVSLRDGAAGHAQLNASLSNPSKVTIVATSAHASRKVAGMVSNTVLVSLFDMVVIDESSQVPVTLALLPIAVMKDGGQLVVAGDPKQMPPIASLEAPVGAEYMVGSIHDYLEQRFRIAPLPLLENYRSSQQIVDYALTLEYPAKLKAARPTLALHALTPHATAQSLLDAALPRSALWEDLLDPSKGVCALLHEDISASQANLHEAKMVAAIVQLIFLSMSPELAPLTPGKSHTTPTSDLLFQKMVGIVTPHKAQRALILNELRTLFPTASRDDLTDAVDTVEKFQGGQRQTIIVSFGVGDVDIIGGEEFFLLQLQRINVAVSRAEAKCIVVMPKSLAYHLPTDKKTLKTAKAIKSYLESFCNLRQPGDVTFADGTIRKAEVRWHG